LTLTSDGGYLLGGYSASSISGNKATQNFGGAISGSSSSTPAETSLDQTFGGTNDDFLYALRPTADNGFILGGYSLSHLPETRRAQITAATTFGDQTPTRPRLNATVSADHILISWPSTFTGYVLETKSALTSANWDPVATVPTDDAQTGPSPSTDNSQPLLPIALAMMRW